MDFPHLFSPLQLGNIELANRVVHVPTDISSSHADGEVSERDLHHHADIARGGTGFIIVGATTPDMKSGRPRSPASWPTATTTSRAWPGWPRACIATGRSARSNSSTPVASA